MVTIKAEALLVMIESIKCTTFRA